MAATLESTSLDGAAPAPPPQPPGENAGWQVGKSVLEVNQHVFENQLRCDVTFELPAGGDAVRRVGAHTLVLTSRSPVFEAMFSERWAGDGEQDAVKIEDVQYDVFREFLRYIYYEKCGITAGNVLALRYTARKYITPQLADTCTRYVDGNIAVHNVCTIFQKSLEFGERDLEERCLQFIYTHAADVLRADDLDALEGDALMKVVESDILFCGDEAVVYRACVGWARRKCLARGLLAADAELRDALGPILFQIRLPRIDSRQIADLLGTSAIVTDEEKGALYTYAFTRTPDARLRFSAKSRAYEIRKVARFSSMKPTSSNHNNCKVHSIVFRVDKEILLLGTTLLACKASRTVGPGTLRVSGPGGSESSQQVAGKEGVDALDVTIRPMMVAPSKDYTLTFAYQTDPAQATTFQIYRGDHGAHAQVTADDVTFTFSNSSIATNGSTFQHGQFHEILFDTCH